MQEPVSCATRRFVTTSVVGTIVYLSCFYYRLDYSAHLAVGCGLAGVLWATAVRTSWQLQTRCLLVVGTVFAIGVVGELTVFGPDFDWVDVANAVIGSALAVAAIGGCEDPGVGGEGVECRRCECRRGGYSNVEHGRVEFGEMERSAEYGVVDEDSKSQRRQLVAAGVVMVACGWLLRYPVGDVTTQWWWRA